MIGGNAPRENNPFRKNLILVWYGRNKLVEREGLWLFFAVVRSSRIALEMIVATASPARAALKNSQLTCGGAFDMCETVH
ncbi:MAG: hypothetical protein C5B58_01675 [Acidobacteria bacterium]|nr:MAG: hypothetical protein C5B58_01675 [Acidobacteriota bacterium]